MAGTTEITSTPPLGEPLPEAKPRPTNGEPRQLSARIRSLLAGLRWRIRAYIWLEGLALAVVWLGLTFWLSLGIDYLPVLIFADELPWQVRGFLLALIAGVLAFILYRWILRRAFVRMADHSMAVVLERRFKNFHDSLVTSVEMNERPDHAVEFNPDMLAHTNEDAQSLVSHVRLRSVFNFTPLVLSSFGAVVLVITIGGFAYLDTENFARAANRVYLLDDEPWPRYAKIEVLGIEVQNSTPAAGEQPSSTLMQFEEGRVKVAKGSSVVLLVRADATKHIPEVCTVRYQLEDGGRDRVNMERIGQPRDGFQQYTYDKKPFRGILSSLEFDVIGFDHRVRDFHIEVVDSPTIVDTKLDCVFPEYMVDLDSSAWTPRTISWNSGTQLPQGTQIKVRCRANKPLQKAIIFDPSSSETQTVVIGRDGEGGEEFEFELPPLRDNLTLEISLHDTDGIIGENPNRITIGAIPDEPPRINAYLRGIGIAVTPDVIVPFEGTVSDDYGVQRAWIDVKATDVDPYEHQFTLGRAGTIATQIDFRELRNDGEMGFALTPGEKNTLEVVVKAVDKYDLGDEPNVGSGERYVLDIVTSDELLAILERLEAGQRQRMEQIYEEMTEARDYLLRVRSTGAEGTDLGAEPEDAIAADGGEDNRPLDVKEKERQVAERLLSLRLLFTQRSLLQSRKSAQEVLGVAATIRDIRQQLINNRLDAEDRKKRLEDEIAGPLQTIGDVLFPELDKRLEELETKLKALETKIDDQPSIAAADQSVEAAIDQADLVLRELQTVLEKLIEFEDYNKLLDLLREMIAEQERLIEETKKQQQKSILGDLLE